MENYSNLLANPAVIWFLMGLVLLMSEFFLPGLIILFFGVGCWIASLALLFMPDMPLNIQLVIFLISSILSLALLRKYLKKWLGKSEKKDDSNLEEYVGKHCIAETDFVPGIGGKVSFRGAQWEAHSNSEIKKGDSLVIKAVESIHLIVEPFNN